uniref:NADH dehydrogenase subunit 4L n=1 Tax=Rhynchospio aff. asiatica ZW-2021 TaxID=2813871 RepID=UPI0023AAE524|nr:NADH dehydrogenase subunit 4L [Rhynchospio aff. asiatica ZW-2021]WCI21130.1 NADH dehydrogenase subunit 4L [Rhynchospio aff. asiatica ZW-2021]
MLTYTLPIILSMALASLMNFVAQRKFILMALLSLEATILNLALAITITASSGASNETFFCFIILTLGACEASVALAILVLITRSYGADTIKSFSINKC